MRIITVASRLEEQGLENLVHSLQKFKHDFDIIVTEWRGFGTKLIEVYEYFRQNPDVEELIFVDAYDVLFLSTPKEIESKILDRSKMLVSVEKGCWPQADLSSKYPETKSEWKYINSGTYYAPRDVYMKMIENNPPQYSDDDQLYLTNEFLNNPNDFVLDYNCEVFQCHSFVAEDDYKYKDGRVFNLKTNSIPCIIHGNGRSDLSKVLKLL